MLAPAGDGAIWIGTLNGLNRYDPIEDRFTRFVHSAAADSLSGDVIYEEKWTF